VFEISFLVPLYYYFFSRFVRAVNKKGTMLQIG